MVIDFFIAHISLLYEFFFVFLLLGLVICVCGVLIARYDKLPVHEGVYFAFITAFTVGLGDVTPKSATARIITIILAFLGLILMGVVVGVAVHAMDIAIGLR